MFWVLCIGRAKGLLTIAEPKTAGSRRLVTLGSLAVDSLARHKENQAAQRLLCGAAWEDTRPRLYKRAGSTDGGRQPSAPVFRAPA